MPSSVAHGLVAVATAHAFFRVVPARVAATAALGAILLDLDAIGRPFGAGDIAWLGGHRALTHALPVNLALAIAAGAVVFRDASWREQRSRIIACLAVAFALHGLADMFTTYGEGVMLFAPVSWHRFKGTWQPFSAILPEAIGLWGPALLFIVLRRSRRPVA